MAEFIPTPEQQAAYNLLRTFFNPAIAGEGTDAVLWALATPAATLITNVQAVNTSMYIATATDRYLEQRLADFGIQKPSEIGLSDDTFRAIGLAVINRKQVRDLVNDILEIIYGVEYTRATLAASTVEPYALIDGDTLYAQFDDGPIQTIIFTTEMFNNIAAATAQEVADAISRNLRANGLQGYATVQNNGNGNFPMVVSPTTGPSSALKILGGRPQNVLQFPQIRLTTGDATTQWTLSSGNEGAIRATWTGGTNPSPGFVKVNDYVNMFSGALDPSNVGTFTITAAVGGPVDSAYFEFVNPLGVAQTFVQGTVQGVLFYNPVRQTIISNINFAACYQTQNKVLQVFMPAITRVVLRTLVGAAHLKASALPLSPPDNLGTYVYDLTKPYSITKNFTTTTQVINPQTRGIINVADSSSIPNAPGFVCFGYGYQGEEGPVPYLGTPSDGTIWIDPAYTFKNIQPSGTTVSQIGVNAPYAPVITRVDYPFYITDITSGTTYAQELINLVAAAGVTVVFTILYPNDIGLAGWGRSGSEKVFVWGNDET